MPRLFVHAINVHQGGGAVLLSDLLVAIPSDVEAEVHIDSRMSVPTNLPRHIRVERIKPTILGRFLAERRLADKALPDDRVLCFGNLPPLFRLRCDVVVFLQNRYLIDPCAPLSALSLKPRVRLWFERAWLRGCRFNASRYLVQTPSMQRLAEQQLGVPVTCASFVPASILKQVHESTEQHFDFIYVASGEPHKNHATLIDAWEVLANNGMFPSLALTLASQSSLDLCNRVAQVAVRGLRIQNIGVLPHGQLLSIYRKAGALIYPSSFESFGLPLIEARLAGLPVLAPELDYVRDVIDPDETFDSTSPISIARAVMRHLEGCKDSLELCGVDSLLKNVLAKEVL